MKELIKNFDPGYFAFVMATGIISIVCHLLGMEGAASALFFLNKAGWAAVFILFLVRSLLFPASLMEAAGRRHGASMFTAVAGTCILGSQYAVIQADPAAALPLWIAGFLLWAVLIYAFFFALVAASPGEAPLEGGAFIFGFDGSWLIFVVGTQSVAILGTLLSQGSYFTAEQAKVLLFISLSMCLLGSVLYIILIGLIFYRMFFFALPPEKLSPAYWINMGAAAITVLSGALLLRDAGRRDFFLSGVVPFLKGFTFLFWAAASWWIPLLAALFIWKYLREARISYDLRLWSVVFPLGMYPACTYELGKAAGLGFLLPIAEWAAYVALAAWAMVFAGLLKRIFLFFLRGIN